MKFAQFAIGSILFIEAFLLLYSPQQRYNFHSFFEYVKEQMSNCPQVQTMCYQCVQKMRFFVIALIISGAYSLTLGNNLIVGILAQLLWTVTQSELYYDQGISQIRNTLIQFFFFVVLIGNLKDQWKKCCNRRQVEAKRQIEQAKAQTKSDESSSVPVGKNQPTEKQPKKEKVGEKESKKSK